MKLPKGRCYWRQKEGCGVRPVKQASPARITQVTVEGGCGAAGCLPTLYENSGLFQISQQSKCLLFLPWVPEFQLPVWYLQGAHLHLLKQTHQLAPLECQPTKIPICLNQMSLGPALCITNIPPAASDTWVQDSSPCTLRIQIMSLDQEND